MTEDEKRVLDFLGKDLPVLLDILAGNESFGVSRTIFIAAANAARELSDEGRLRAAYEWFARLRTDVIEAEEATVVISGDGDVKIQD